MPLWITPYDSLSLAIDMSRASISHCTRCSSVNKSTLVDLRFPYAIEAEELVPYEFDIVCFEYGWNWSKCYFRQACLITNIKDRWLPTAFSRVTRNVIPLVFLIHVSHRRSKDINYPDNFSNRMTHYLSCSIRTWFRPQRNISPIRDSHSLDFICQLM